MSNPTNPVVGYCADPDTGERVEVRFDAQSWLADRLSSCGPVTSPGEFPPSVGKTPLVKGLS